jgi:hypothetical protein
MRSYDARGGKEGAYREQREIMTRTLYLGAHRQRHRTVRVRTVINLFTLYDVTRNSIYMRVVKAGCGIFSRMDAATHNSMSTGRLSNEV